MNFINPNRKWWLIGIIIVLLLVSVLVSVPSLRQFILTQLPTIVTQQVMTTMLLTVPPNAQLGDYVFNVTWENPDENTLIAQSERVTLTVVSPSPTPSTTPVPTIQPTSSPPPSPSPSATSSPLPAVTPTPSITPVPTIQPTSSPPPSATVTPLPAVTPTPSPILSSNPTVTPTPSPPAEQSNAPSGGDDSGGGGGGDGGGGESETGEIGQLPVESVRPASLAPTMQAESAYRIAGSYSGIRQEGKKKVVVLAHSRAVWEDKVSVARGDYYLEFNARHDKPGPVDVAIYINNRAWKVLRLDKNDNQYRTHRAGLLRNFQGGTIRFKFLNDTYDRSDPSNEASDRNLYLDWWRLTTSNSPGVVSPGTRQTFSGGVASGGRSRGWALLPRLNSFVRQELGEEFVRHDIWSYYARRLTLPTSSRESIQSDSHLQNVMRYWKGARPGRPRGD